MNETTTKVPRHLWLVGVLALLWNAMGAFDYTATKFRVEAYLSGYSPEQLAYFFGFPAWAVATWAIAVWSELIGSVGLLMRKAWCVWLFGVSIVAMMITGIYNFGLSEGIAMMGTGAVAFTAVIWIVAFSLFFYARAMAKRGVLR